MRRSGVDAGRLSERLMGMDEAAWARHANPWSGWSRVLALPLLTLAIWSRAWIGGYAGVPVGLVLLWIWLNPRVFPVPATTSAWMSRGVLGERLWLDRRKRPVPRRRAVWGQVFSLATAIGALLLGWGLWFFSLPLVLCGLVLASGGKLLFLDQMVRLKDQVDGPPQG